MKVAVFGATGATGIEIVKSLAAAGHEVVAAARRPEAVSAPEGVIVKTMDIKDESTLRDAMTGCHVIVSAIGTGGLGSARRYTTLYTDCTRALRSAMRKEGVKRIIALSSGGVQEDEGAPWVYNSIIRRYTMNTYLDMARMEAILEESEGIEFTSVRLVRLLPNTKKGKEIVVKDRVLGAGSYGITYEDAGKFVADECVQRKWINMYPVPSYT